MELGKLFINVFFTFGLGYFIELGVNFIAIEFGWVILMVGLLILCLESEEWFYIFVSVMLFKVGW